jgi:hypothetical protein
VIDQAMWASTWRSARRVFGRCQRTVRLDGSSAGQTVMTTAVPAS